MASSTDSVEARIADALATTTRLQGEAADPQASVWVSANAGTGKTHVLTQRVLRLLLSGTAPERILCLTYTKAAAAEMSKRVFDTLSIWVGLDDPALKATLAKLLGATPATRELALARTLFTRAIETPGGFKVQTIHAFCEHLLQRFPLEAGVAPGFKILDDHTARTLIRDAIDATLITATSDRATPLGAALTTAVRYAADETFDTMLTEAIKQRALLASFIRRADLTDLIDPFDEAADQLRACLNVRKYTTPEAIRAELAGLLDTPVLKRLADALGSGSTQDINNVPHVAEAAGSTGDARIDALARYFLTKERSLRSSLMTKAVREEHLGLAGQAEAAQARFHTLDCELRALEAVDATIALYRLADTVLQNYQTAKAARAALDFEDLIVKTCSLFNQPGGAAWVLYKLDGGLDHILVDEAQDTAPGQWSVIEAIAAEFFAGRGSNAEAGTRTVFAVGDEKQSIYSFQGAAPEMFAATGARFKALAEGVGMPWRATALTLSFRTVAPILAAVDKVFADAAVTPGLTMGSGAAIGHAVKRAGQAGLVEIWPTELPQDKDDTDAWSPLDEATRSSPVTRLAERIARTIRGWLDTGELLASQNRPIRAGDILILVRKREPFAPAIVAALKSIKVPVAGADRITLTRQIGVQDLLALGDFLTLPEDDLALATVLKSPLFGLDDDDLLSLAHDRRGTLWKALLDHPEPRYEPARAQLKRWRKEADFLPPFEFYSCVLDHDRGRMKLLERLGPEAADGIDEFLNLALSYDDQAPPSLTGFLSWVRADERQIKRDMDQGRDEVRVLTVHGAKGLEAPIVILPDTCSTGSGSNANGLLTLAGSAPSASYPDLAVWPVKGSATLPAIASAKAHVKTREGEELNRLLYVGLTRARDRLYVAGFQSREKLQAGCWYDIITRALADDLVAFQYPDGATVRRLTASQTAPPEPRGIDVASDGTPAPRPGWMSTQAPREPSPAIPLAPSRLAPYDFDAAGEPAPLAAGTPSIDPAGPVVPAPQRGSRDHRFLRGTLTHALLEHLPQLLAATWPQAAASFLDQRGAELAPAVRRSILSETLAVLNDPVFAPLFGPKSRAEIPIVAELPNPGGRGAALKIHGQIDRLAETGTEILIVDYKTNRPPPTDITQVAETYLVQLAAYRCALMAIFPHHTVRAALLWTQTPSLMEIPAETLDAYSSRLWEYGTPKLDGTGLRS